MTNADEKLVEEAAEEIRELFDAAGWAAILPILRDLIQKVREAGTPITDAADALYEDSVRRSEALEAERRKGTPAALDAGEGE